MRRLVADGSLGRLRTTVRAGPVTHRTRSRISTPGERRGTIAAERFKRSLDG